MATWVSSAPLTAVFYPFYPGRKEPERQSPSIVAPLKFPPHSLQRRRSQAARALRGEAREETLERAERARGLQELVEQRKQDLVKARPWGAVTAGVVPQRGQGLDGAVPARAGP